MTMRLHNEQIILLDPDILLENHLPQEINARVAQIAAPSKTPHKPLGFNPQKQCLCHVPEMGASALCCSVDPVVGFEERPWFGAPFCSRDKMQKALIQRFKDTFI